MILLLGGTSETATLAEALATAGYRVLVSTATDIPLSVGSHRNIAHRTGRLSEPAMKALIQQEGIQVIVDATHPYASEIRTMAGRMADALGIHYLPFVRPRAAIPGDVRVVATHEEAAKIACSAKGPVLLTIGSKDLRPYAKAAALSNTPLVVRVLPHPDSIDSCRRAGIPVERIVAGRGPFGIEDNRQVIRQFDIKVLVTKNSGTAGGIMEKLEASRLENCLVVVVDRPPLLSMCTFDDVNTLVRELPIRIGRGT